MCAEKLPRPDKQMLHQLWSLTARSPAISDSYTTSQCQNSIFNLRVARNQIPTPFFLRSIVIGKPEEILLAADDDTLTNYALCLLVHGLNIVWAHHGYLCHEIKQKWWSMLWRILSYANNYRVPTVHIHIPYCLNEYFIFFKIKLGGNYVSRMQKIVALS